MHKFHLLIAFIVGGALTITVVRWRLRESPIEFWRIVACIFITLAAGAMGSKLFAFWFSGLPLSAFSLSTLMGSGTRHPGFIVALLVVVPFLLRTMIPKGWRLETADAIALAMLLCLPLYRITCHLNGCCVGGVCNHGYCITYPAMSSVYFEQIRAGLIVPGAAQSLPIFPLHAFIALSSVLSFIVLLWFDRYKDYAGQLVLLYLVLNEGLKAVLETWRVPYVAELQVASVLFAVLGLLGLIVFGWRHNRRQRAV